MINRIDLFLNGFSLSSDYTISTQENNVIIDDEEFSQIAIDISNVVLSHPDGDYAGLVATTEIVSLSSSVEYAPYGNSQICPYYAIRAYVNGSYAYYYSNGEKKVCPYSISGKNVIYDSSFSVISQVATSTYTDGGFYTIGTRDYYIGAYLIWGAYYTGFTQYVTANEFSWLKVINSVTVQRGTSTTYSFSVTGLTQGY